MLDALRAHRPVPPGPFIVKHPSSLYAREEWLKINQSGTINYLPANIRASLASTFRYQMQDHFLDLLDRSNQDLTRAASVLRSPTDPPHNTFEQNMAFADFFRRFEAAHENLPQQQVDAAWDTNAEPGNVAALSPAQLDALARALQVALADDDAMLASCYTVKRNLVRNPVP